MSLHARALGAGLAVTLLATAAGAEARLLEHRFPVDGKLLGAHLHDQDGDGRMDLTLAVLEPRTRRRELRVHLAGADGRVAAEPAHVLKVLDDVVAWGWADVRDDPGAELLMLTRSGAFALSPSRPGLRDNLERLVETPLIYDVPDPASLPRWRYVLPHPDGDRILLPESGGYRIWGPPRPGDEVGPEGGPRYVIHTDLVAVPGQVRLTAEAYDDARDDTLIDSALDLAGRSLGVGANVAVRRFLQDGVEVRAPALVDVDGDGLTDLVHREGGLRIHLADAHGIPAEPTRIETLPDSVAPKPKENRELLLQDVDGDGDCDMLVALRGERDDVLGNRVHEVFVLRNDGRRMIPERADDLRRVEGAWSRTGVADVNGDGRPDMVLEKAKGPSQLDLVSGKAAELEYSLIVFFGDERGAFARKPSFSETARFPFDSIGEALSSTNLSHDLDGDGYADRVDLSQSGVLSIRRVRLVSSFFGGDTWSLEPGPWKRFEDAGRMGNLVVTDANADGLGDVLTWSDDRATLLLSRRGR